MKSGTSQQSIKPTLTGAFLRLIRWPNLFFIALTQCLFYFCVLKPSIQGGRIMDTGDAGLLMLTATNFAFLCLSSVLIAAAGYIINDYFDLNIDRVNKPDRLVVGRVINRRWAILWHWILSGLGVLLGFYVSMKIHNWIVGFANLGCVILLWFYSTTFKKKLLIGNVIISLLTAWVIIVLYICEIRFAIFRNPYFHQGFARAFKFTMLYAGFAFIISLVREVIKDIEDMDGDGRYGCHTMPIVWGVNASKLFAATWIIVLTGSLVVIAVYALQYGWLLIMLYCLLLLVLPLIWILTRLYRAVTPADYHLLSNMVKAVMLVGILSMLTLEII